MISLESAEPKSHRGDLNLNPKCRKRSFTLKKIHTQVPPGGLDFFFLNGESMINIKIHTQVPPGGLDFLKNGESTINMKIHTQVPPGGLNVSDQVPPGGLDFFFE